MGSVTILLAIVMARPPAVSVGLVPAQPDAACGARARACFAPALVSIRNRSSKILTVDGISLIGPVGGEHRPIRPAVRIQPSATYQAPEVFEVHVEATYRASVGIVAPKGHSGQEVRVELDPGLRAAALARCSRCHPEQPGTCACSASDAGQRCTDATDCQGACLFERFEERPPTPCPPGLRCGESPRAGVRVGRCSQWRVPIGCVDVIPRRDPPGRLEPLSAPTNRRCFD